ncbi:MAG TPA: type I-C CRISPR-associated protein Cas7/Csd2 [Candidatus Ornithoclostridium faecigallinarum]|nr:type I-C CRISPR-associated protein Cas7/Csd2 [Candidatus Ornithoclostridium faecigallinarum]
MAEVIKNRYEFVVLFDVENGNPNGDPDADNAPRSDAETGLGVVTDVCLKRKIRNYVEIVTESNPQKYNIEGEPKYNILIKTDKTLNAKFEDAYDQKGLKKGKNNKSNESIEAAREYMCFNYYDVRTFGAVMSTGDNPCGIVRGPVQLNFARSIDPIYPQELTITRQAVTNAGRIKEDKLTGTTTEMGKKNVVPYALYRAEGYVSAMLAQKSTGFNEVDLALLWDALINMFEHDHSAARGKVAVRKLIVFKHDSMLGNAPSVVLFDKIKIAKKPGVEYPRAYFDYEISIDETMPAGVEMIVKL